MRKYTGPKPATGRFATKADLDKYVFEANRNGLNQSAIANSAAVSIGLVNKILNSGQRKPRIIYLVKPQRRPDAKAND